ncbi:MAG: hypothetical protein EBR33_04735 [Synechococcaceae bacterium WB4_1_0192]|nr:hypothetical protein [Synechococcaceae bacterium WB4_1_0192]
MPPPDPLSWEQDPLDLDPSWDSPIPLLPLQQALDQTVFQSGLSREAWLRRLAGQLHRRGPYGRSAPSAAAGPAG